jgi:signal transduction histidine kinase
MRQRAGHSFRQSLRLRLVLVFLLLALGMTIAFLGGMQKALSVGWRDAARPLVADYVDRLVVDLGSPPSIERAQALAQRLPVSVRISGPVVNWQSEPSGPSSNDDWRRGRGWLDDDPDRAAEGDARLLQRTTADGHRISLGLSASRWQNHPRRVGWYTLTVLLVLTALAYAYVRRLLRPLDDIRAGARRFGAGDFALPIPVRRRDELGALADDVNTMAQAIHQMLESKRGLLLAISHELRSPLTRARLNTELLPESEEAGPLREALLRDLAAMRDLITDLLEGERLGRGHAALQLEPTDMAALVREVVAGFGADHSAQMAELDLGASLPQPMLDRARMRLLVRNLLDNALRHSTDAGTPPRIGLAVEGEGDAARLVLSVRDHGAGVPEDVLPHLAEPFYRPDAARERTTGGVGLGLYLCKLVVQAHGGSFSVRNAGPGLLVTVSLPL